MCIRDSYSNEENYLGSDSYALKSMTNKISYLDDGDLCVLSKDKVEFYDLNKKKINKKVYVLSDLSELIGTFKDPNPNSHLQYRFELMVLVQKLIEQQPDLASKSALYDLTDNLAKLIDELQGENVTPMMIKNLNVEDHSGHWQRILHFMDIVVDYLEERSLEPDSEGFQRNQVLKLLRAWEEYPPENYILEEIYQANLMFYRKPKRSVWIRMVNMNHFYKMSLQISDQKSGFRRKLTF